MCTFLPASFSTQPHLGTQDGTSQTRLSTTLVLNMKFNFTFAHTGNSIIDNGGSSNQSVILGGYFGVHLRGMGAPDCGEIDDESGIYLVEAMRYAINNINKNSSILFGVELGYRIVDTCSSVRKLRYDFQSMILHPKIVGIIGPSTSDEAIISSVAFGIFNMGIISPSATSIQLANREKYYNFYRTIPSDDIQASVLADILDYFKWNYVHTVNSHGNYGQQGMENLISLLNSKGVCISTRNSLPQKPSFADFQRVFGNLEKDRNARTVVLFTTAVDTNSLLRVANASKSRFTWLSSSAWMADKTTIDGVNEAAKGALLLNYAGINSMDFFNHFVSLKLNTNRYKWFEEFWNKTFSCDVRNCTGAENISASGFYGKYAAAGAVIDAVNSFAYALRCTLSRCVDIPRCIASFSLAGYTRRYIDRTKHCQDPFNLSVNYSAQGSLYRDVEIVNYNGTTYNTVGVWKKAGNESKLQLDHSKIVWFTGTEQPPESICSKPCKTGERKVVSKTKECCFTCHACQADEFLVNNTCIKCGKYELPDENKTRCMKLEKLEVKITNYMSIIILTESVVGFLLNSFVLYLFIRHKDSKIVKSSSRELSFFMLGGLYLCFISPCIFLLNPTVVRCGLRRFIFGLSLTACYTPLMLKTNRIYRIFRAARFMVSMPFLVSPTSQILICFALISLQLLISIMWVVGDLPVVSHKIVDEYKMVADLCGADIFTIIINVIPCFCMLAASTVYAFKSRKYPKNYNEAYNIGVTMYLSCVLWAIFIPLLLLVKTQSINPFGTTFVIANFSNIIGLSSLCGLFGPKVRRIVCSKDGEFEAKVTFSNAEKNSVAMPSSQNFAYVVRNEGARQDRPKTVKIEAVKQENSLNSDKRRLQKSKSF